MSDKTRADLLELSAATADRIFRQFRFDHRPHGKTTTKSGQLLKHRVPIRTFADWADTRPGFMEAGRVAHCGRNSEGPFLHTLVLTDVATGWTECLALLRRTETDILQALTTARQILPFQLVGLDTDNGSEFMNYGLLAYCERETIQFTRGRERRKNDQCFVEQKNASIVRPLVGYDRYEGLLAYRQLAELYRVVRLYVHFFQPSMKLTTKTRDGSQVTKRYDIAQTPYQRLSNSDALGPEVRDHRPCCMDDPEGFLIRVSSPQAQIPQLLQVNHGNQGRPESSEHNDRTRTACVRTHRLTLPLGKGRIPSPPRSMQQRCYLPDFGGGGGGRRPFRIGGIGGFGGFGGFGGGFGGVLGSESC